MGEIGLDRADASLTPTPLVAVTVNVEVVSLGSRETVQLVVPMEVHCCPPGAPVTVYATPSWPREEIWLTQ